MRFIAPALVGILLAACSAVDVGVSETQSPPITTDAGPTSSVAPRTSTTAPAVVAVPPPRYEAIECNRTPTVAFSVLCEAVESVLEYHVDAPDIESLVAAAKVGLASVEDVQGDPGFDEFTCYFPDETFIALCDAISERAQTVRAPVGDFVEAAVEGMFSYGLDPFSVYVPGDVFDGGFDDTGYVYSLGMVVSPRTSDGAACAPIGGACRAEIVSVFDFSAARRAGASPGDIVETVDGESVDGLIGPEVVALLEGAPGTTVDVELDRRGDTLSRTFEREDIRFTPTEWEALDGGIAYFRMNDFSQQAAIDLGAFLQSDIVTTANALILDLRDNPGGLVLAAQAVASQFLDGGIVLVEQGRDYREELPVVEGGLATSGLDLVVLVNRGSASASEIVAAVLQERGRAVVIGESTFGKNLVQWVTETRDGGQMRVTVARWETPDGLDIGIRGLAPDVEVSADPESVEDEVLEAAVAALR